jgi:hypothetical protein
MSVTRAKVGCMKSVHISWGALARPTRISGLLMSLVVVFGLVGCASVGIGVSLPIPGLGSVGIGVDSNGQVGGGVSIGTGGVSVGVGGSGRLPQAPAAPASAPNAPGR